jgi:hypothetical protein
MTPAIVAIVKWLVNLLYGFLTKLDDKSGYDNVLMSENSKSFGVSMEWSLFLM